MKLLILFLFCFSFLNGISAQVYSVISDNGSSFTVVAGFNENAIATAHHEVVQDRIGWNKLKVSVVESNPSSNIIKMKAAGFIEGYLLQNEIFDAYYNFANGTGDPTTPQMKTFITQNDKWLRQNAFAQNADTYWTTVGLLISQYDGIIEGYQAAASPATQLSTYLLTVYGLQFELGDIAAATSLKEKHMDYHTLKAHLSNNNPFFKTNRGQSKLIGDMAEHCSSFIKLTNGNAKLMTSHDTWSTFNTMLREYKRYDTPIGKVQFSSYPGLPYSGDDFYINDKKLVVLETTNSVFNTSLYSATTTQTVPYWLRVQVATYLATNGPEWHKYFSTLNNGGYNNQWMVVDYKLFTPNSPLKLNTLVIGEQVPGYYVYEDQTKYLTTNGYWGSYNIPFYPFIYNISGYPAFYQKYGNEYSWSECARAKIYRRDQNTAQNVAQFQYVQRYNHYQVDPLSLQDACRGISARCDLNVPWTNNSTLNGYAAFGAIDSKMTDENMVGNMASFAIAGPSWKSQSIFWWSDAWNYIPHKGLVSTYAFEWVLMD